MKRNLYYTLQGIQKTFPASKSVLTKIPTLKTYATLADVPNLSRYVDSAIASCANPPVFGLSMYQTLYNSQVTLNNHIDIASQYASNMRLYLKQLLGSEYKALQIGRFRQGGEIHQWMYDRYSLSVLLNKIGLEQVKKCSAKESYVPNWISWNLDTEPDGSIYKPDSLYMEGIKPA
jgi:hypothetical protein